ncbi:hypothetical protein KIM372_14250 [Bombiscardovia nodaiensis]|uniref:Internalin-A n=1 Tax=Bombiscardovia nodaiensis TaxID=2932181 RepID=A0ABM8B9R9_9BIFI|nr:hypothetical protein KIM372_14250 [Bombiscardovia nodaiensis]
MTILGGGYASLAATQPAHAEPTTTTTQRTSPTPNKNSNAAAQHTPNNHTNATQPTLSNRTNSPNQTPQKPNPQLNTSTPAPTLEPQPQTSNQHKAQTTTPPLTAEHTAAQTPQPKNSNLSQPTAQTKSASAEQQSESQPKLTTRGNPCTINVSSIATCVPDPNLANHIAATLSTTTSATLTTTLINSLTGLYACNAGIVSVEGIQYFTKLQTLYLYNNQITDLSPVTGLPDLTNLEAYSNLITNAGQLNNPNLLVLYLSNNKLSSVTSITWNSLTKLQELSLGNNQITDLSLVTGLPSLISLDASNNLITNPGQLNNPNLLILYLAGNKLSSIASISWNRLTKLVKLNLETNQITDLSPVTGLPVLNEFYAGNNLITNPGQLNNPNLGKLNLSNNKLSSVAGITWNNLTNLGELWLNRNQITDLSPVTGVPFLADLYAQDNLITNPGQLNNPNLLVLYLSNNKLSSVTSITWNNLSKLQKLNLETNQITDLSPVTGLPSLTSLEAFSNLITNPGQLNNPNLTLLYLSGNKIPSVASINWNNLTKLQQIDLQGNQITDLSPLNPVHSLTDLNASDNLITNAGQLNNPNLERLYLFTNKLSSVASITWNSLTKLQQLSLSNNQITDLSLVTGLPSLTQLEAQNNLITNPGQLNNPNLLVLYLAGNKLSSIASITWNSLTKLQQLDLQYNQITDITSINWNSLTGLTYGYSVKLSNQRVRLPDLPGSSDSPLTLGPATISHSPNAYARPGVYGRPNIDASTPSGGSYNTGDGTYTWAHSYPGDHQYTFQSNVTLPYTSQTPSFDGVISQLVPGYAVTFDPNGGTLHSPAVVAVSTVGTYIGEPSPKPTKSDGYSFLGWYTAANGGNKWDFGSMPVNGDMTLYAHWAPTFTLPQAGAIPLQQWSGGGLLAASAAVGLAYAGQQIRRHRRRRGRHSLATSKQVVYASQCTETVYSPASTTSAS